MSKSLYTVYEIVGNDLVVVIAGCTGQEVKDFLGVNNYNGKNHGLVEYSVNKKGETVLKNLYKLAVHTTKKYTVIKDK